MDSKNDCLLCGAELVYLDEPVDMECVICHKHFMSNVSCGNGHYVCDACHSRNAIPIITEVCLHSSSKDPIEIMNRLMKQPCIHMHGPEHHVLVGSALLTAYYNCGGELDLQKALPEMARRGSQVPGGACGFWGCCGAAVSAGMYVSIVTGCKPTKNQEWGLSNLMTAKALDIIGRVGGPRCCKRDSFLAALAAAEFTEENFGIQMELPEKIQCEFFSLNRECIEDRCPFFDAGKDVASDV